ncbi:MAG: FliI/YscN family ATPase [Deferribacterota bacterium]|nr:FliI/YscN family ATPase [Deferribacterota bacterium]
MKNLRLLSQIEPFEKLSFCGYVKKIVGLTIEADGPMLGIGSRCIIENIFGNKILAEIVGFRDDRVLLMPYSDSNGIEPGSVVKSIDKDNYVKVSEKLLGRIVNGLGKPIDGMGNIENFTRMSVYNSPPTPLEREIISEILPTGVKAIDTLLTVGKGQRMGIFAGSGVGKSVLLGMIAKNTKADVNVIALIGERGREVREFIEKDLEDALEKSVVVVVTSDESPLVRKNGAFLAMAIAEYFRDKGLDVLFMMDSVTRFAMAQREIGLAAGEPPTTKGYTPSVFSLLPRLLERAGTKKDRGSITGLFTVLIEADDINDPIGDAVRAIIDGHIFLSRDLASKNHYPAIDVLNSTSRLMKEIVDNQHDNLASKLRDMLAIYKNNEDLVNIGAYKKGTNKKLDYVLNKIDLINDFLKQNKNTGVTFDESLKRLKNLLL